MAAVSTARVREWLRRYGPAEGLSLAATLGAAAAATHAGSPEVGRALAATWAGNLAYFGYLLGQDVWHTRQALRTQGRRYTAGTLGRNIRALVVEFGVAEVLDSLLIRPALLYWLPRWLHSVPLGVLAAKLAADVTFYVPTIISYELSKHRLRKF
ncbi:hypothetical protein [Hymenobacter cheonanensis]|uniref:hypothetical protein n=1 Tax=Hymenobacter sp. CA2-7 TaxID=3063993 RepID=UPI002712DBF1|nr:hypothetical protein [Hymenobacter sp. CA2-7]MDO7884459.1 hypothetical protein [Hymenobacter sp. CA2-7]